MTKISVINVWCTLDWHAMCFWIRYFFWDLLFWCFNLMHTMCQHYFFFELLLDWPFGLQHLKIPHWWAPNWVTKGKTGDTQLGLSMIRFFIRNPRNPIWKNKFGITYIQFEIYLIRKVHLRIINESNSVIPISTPKKIHLKKSLKYRGTLRIYVNMWLRSYL